MSNRIKSLDDFLLLLKGVKPGKAGQYTALCPGHDDRNRSLSVKQADDKLLVKCFAGCDTADILKPISLEPKDLFLNSQKTYIEYFACNWRPRGVGGNRQKRSTSYFRFKMPYKESFLNIFAGNRLTNRKI